jgi:hypothetical protein
VTDELRTCLSSHPFEFAGSETAVEARLGRVINPVDYVQPLVAAKHSRMSTLDLPPTILK